MPYTQGSSEGLPEAARKRLAEMRGGNGKKGFFTSDLSVNEFLLCQEAGFDPVGLVMGSSIYHIGYQTRNLNQNQELAVLTQAMYAARELAMTRMEEEADILGADGIVGVRLVATRSAWGAELAEFMAVGTAIKNRAGSNYRTNSNRPFTSDLSGQDFWTLLKAGYQPLSLVMGTCVYHVAHLGVMQSLKQLGQNVEMANYTQALYDARELALSRMQAEAEREGATGIVGAQVREGSYGWEPFVIEYFAVGTAVKPIEGAPPVPAPTMTLPLVG